MKLEKGTGKFLKDWFLLERKQTQGSTQTLRTAGANTRIKMESIRKLSNCNFQWTKTLYQNNLKHIAFCFLHFLRAMDVICYL